jgi:hypothetical protein
MESAGPVRIDSGWAKKGILRGLGNTFKEPGDAALALRIGIFVARMPKRLAKQPLDQMLREIDQKKRDEAMNVADESRIVRLRQAWLASPMFRERNTCYLRAFTLYRFLNAGNNHLAFHVGVEPGVDPADRLHGHAWVTIDGRILEAPEPVLAGRVRELFSHRSDA